MSKNQPSTETDVQQYSASMGNVLQVLYERYPAHIDIAEFEPFFEEDPAVSGPMLRGAIILLHAIGVVEIRNDEVFVPSRHASYVLGSLSKFLKSGIVAIDPPDSYDRFRDLTKILELARIDPNKRNQVDQNPLHRRRIINVLLKTRMKRRWKYRDVYLFSYHPDWNQFHLIGLSHHGLPETDEQIVERTMRNFLNLQPSEYEIDFLRNPQTIVETRISESHGALTEYTFRLIIIKNLKSRLNISRLPQNALKPLRWFTWEEICERTSRAGEKIMFSSPIIMRPLDPESLPISVARADDARAHTSIADELGNRLTFNQIIVALLLLLAFISLQFVSLLLNVLQAPNTTLQNLAAVASVVGALVGIVGLILVLIRKE